MSDAPATERKKPLLEVRDLKQHFTITRGVVFSRVCGSVKAVDGISFSILPGETLGLVGESGCGKSTTGRSILQLYKPTSGSIRFDGTELVGLDKQALLSIRSRMQMVFQDSYSSLNPRHSVRKIIAEPMVINGSYSSRQIQTRVGELLELVGLNPRHQTRYPHEFSGGQRQRVAIARALAMEPELLICDEAVSALDVSVQAQVLNLLNDLKQSFGLTYLFISHDLSVVKYMSDRVIVMKEGKMVEIQEADALYEHPESEYTRKLIAAIPTL